MHAAVSICAVARGPAVVGADTANLKPPEELEPGARFAYARLAAVLIAGAFLALLMIGGAGAAEASHHIGGDTLIEQDGDNLNIIVTNIQESSVSFNSVPAVELYKVPSPGTFDLDSAVFKETLATDSDKVEISGTSDRVYEVPATLDWTGLEPGHYVVHGDLAARVSGIENHPGGSSTYSLTASFTVEGTGDTAESVVLPPRLDSDVITLVAQGYGYSQNLAAGDQRGEGLAYEILTSSESTAPFYELGPIPGMTISQNGQIEIPSHVTDGWAPGSKWVFKARVSNGDAYGDFTDREIMLTVVDDTPPTMTDVGALEIVGEPISVELDRSQALTFDLEATTPGDVSELEWFVSGPQAIIDPDTGWVSITGSGDSATLSIHPESGDTATAGQTYGFNVEVRQGGLVDSMFVQARIIDDPQVADHLDLTILEGGESVPGPFAIYDDEDDVTFYVVLRDSAGYRVTTGDDTQATVALDALDSSIAAWSSSTVALDAGAAATTLDAAGTGTLSLTGAVEGGNLEGSAFAETLDVLAVPSGLVIDTDEITVDRDENVVVRIVDAAGNTVTNGPAASNAVVADVTSTDGIGLTHDDNFNLVDGVGQLVLNADDTGEVSVKVSTSISDRHVIDDFEVTKSLTVGSPPSPSPSPTPAPTPTTDPDGELARPTTGTSQVTIGGESGDDDVTVDSDTNSSTISGDGFAISVWNADGDGAPTGTGVGDVFRLPQGGNAGVSVEGFAPYSTVRVWLFSEPELIGEFVTDADGALEVGLAEVTEDLSPCDHTLQAEGRLGDGRDVAAAMGVWLVANPFPFGDVDPDGFHAPGIGCLEHLDIAHGVADGVYDEEATVSRGQAASLTARALGEDLSGTSSFADANASVHDGAIAALEALEIVAGRADGSFDAAGDVSRGHAATILAEAAGLDTSGTTSFADAAGSVHSGAIAALVQAGIIDGYGDGTFRPGEAVSRAQFASMLALTLPHLDVDLDGDDA